MQSVSTPTWGYKVLSDSQIAFYHILLSKIPVKALKRRISDIQSIKKQKDGSVTISLKSLGLHQHIVEKILSYIDTKNKSSLDTPFYYYKITPQLRQILRQWSLTIESSLAILLLQDKRIASHLQEDWHLINSYVGGVYLTPFTLFLYHDHAKVIHPVISENTALRKHIERLTASYVRILCIKIAKAPTDTIGKVILSYVQEKTGISQEKLIEIINIKSAGIKLPTYSPFFTQEA